MKFNVSATASRPAGVALFVLGRNNLNPSVRVDERGMTIKVVRTTRLAWSEITSMRRRSALRSSILAVRSGGWEYLLYFRDLASLEALELSLRDNGVRTA